MNINQVEKLRKIVRIRKLATKNNKIFDCTMKKTLVHYRMVLTICHAQYATLSKRNSKVPPRIDPHIETLLQGGYHYINIT